MHRQALAICDKWLGSAHEYTIECVSLLATNFDGQRRHGEAESLHQRALEGYRALLADHPVTGRTAFLAARNLVALGREADACRFALQARDILSARVPSTHKWMGKTLSFLKDHCAAGADG